MRKTLGVAILMTATAIVVAQQPDLPPPPTRFGIPSNVETFPQSTPKDTLNAVVRALERNKTEYLVAHLIDPKFIDARVMDRAKQLESSVDLELRATRDYQRQNPSRIPPDAVLPTDPDNFTLYVRTEAVKRAFKHVVKDIRGVLTENPDHLKDLRLFAKNGLFADVGDVSNVTRRDLKERQVFFKKGIDGRWFMEDRQTPDEVKK